MKRPVLVLAVLAALAACTSSTESEEPTPTVSESQVASPTISVSPETTAPPSSPASTPTPTPTPTPTATSGATSGAGDEAFCDYLERTAGAQQTVEGPEQYVALVAGAQAVAPGAIADDLALYVTSARKLALTITGSASEAEKAQKWLNRNAEAVNTAEANLNGYAESTCGRPFLTGEGG